MEVDGSPPDLEFEDLESEDDDPPPCNGRYVGCESELGVRIPGVEPGFEGVFGVVLPGLDGVFGVVLPELNGVWPGVDGFVVSVLSLREL